MIYIKRVVFCLLISEIRFLSHSEEDFLFFRYVKGGSYQVSDAGKSKFFVSLFCLDLSIFPPNLLFPIFKSPHTFFPFHFLYLGTYPYFFS